METMSESNIHYNVSKHLIYQSEERILLIDHKNTSKHFLLIPRVQ